MVEKVHETENNYTTVRLSLPRAPWHSLGFLRSSREDSFNFYIMNWICYPQRKHDIILGALRKRNMCFVTIWKQACQKIVFTSILRPFGRKDTYSRGRLWEPQEGGVRSPSFLFQDILWFPATATIGCQGAMLAFHITNWSACLFLIESEFDLNSI